MAVSFSYTVKNEICGCELFNRPCCKKAELYGILLFSACYSEKEFRLSTGHIAVALRCVALIKELLGIELKPEIKDKVYTVKAEKRNAFDLYHAFGNEGVAVLHILRENFDCDVCLSAFVAGAFLASGTVTSPEKAYRIEISSTHKHRIYDLKQILEELEMKPRETVRGNSYLLYLRDSESIESALAVMGATGCVLDLMSAKVEKDLRNRANRAVNVETANLNRTLAVALEQQKAIEYLRKVGQFDLLDSDLTDVALLRLANPECSLTQLAALSGLSRSVVNTRLKKLVALCEELKKGEK